MSRPVFRSLRIPPFSFGLRLFCACFLAVITHTWVNTQLRQQSEQESLEANYLLLGQSLADSLAAAAVEPLLVRDYPVLDTLLERVIESGEWIVSCTVYRQDGEAVASEVGSDEGTPLVASQSIVVGEDVLGRVDVALSREHVLAAIARKQADLWQSALFAAAALSLVLALLLRHMAGKPVARLEHQVRRLSEDDFKGHIEYVGDREFGGFARALETMRLEVLSTRESLVLQNTDLENALHAAEASDEAKAAFIATMSHEIRTPLMGILGAASVLQDMGGLSDDQEDLLATVCTSSEFLLSQINDILDYSKAAASQLDLESKPVSVGPWLERVVSVLAGRTREHGLELTAVVESEAPLEVIGDAQRLGQVLLNMLGNAVKFTLEGSIALRVSACELGLRIEIQDTGPGLPPGVDSDKLFEPFQQGLQQAPGSEAGTGLGLSICKVFVESMGGTIGTSPTSVGALFWIELPAPADHSSDPAARVPDGLPAGVRLEGAAGTLHREAAEQLAQWGLKVDSAQAVPLGLEELNGVLSPARLAKLLQPRVPTEQPAVPESAPRSLSILAVDDNPVNRKMLQVMLQRLGHQTQLADDGDTALELFKGQSFDLVLMDFHMPRMGGADATRAMHAHSREQGLELTPIIAVSAAVGAREQQACAEAGMDGVLNKPFRIDDLRNLLEQRFGSLGQSPKAA